MVFRRFSKVRILASAVLLGAAYKTLPNQAQNQPAVGDELMCSNKPAAAVTPWNYNWDHRDPKHIVAPPQHEGVEEVENYNKRLKKHTPSVTRHIVMVRHGEYLRAGNSMTDSLTERGRLQAQFAGKRLNEMNIKWSEIYCSTMQRARETADIILKEIDYEPESMQHNALLCEGAPIKPEPLKIKRRDLDYFRDHPRIEAAFRQFIHRALPTEQQDNYTLIVGHANVTRYMVCRALQLPPQAWLRMDINHASITWLTVYPSGNVAIKYLGDTGFIPAEYLTNHAVRVKKQPAPHKTEQFIV